MKGPAIRRDPTASASKAPRATLMFWLVKILATTIGETGGDAASLTLRLGYAEATVLFLAFFALALTAQLRVRRYHPATYWLTVVGTTTAGTVTSDFIDRTLHFGYLLSSAFLFALVVALLLGWRTAMGRIAADRITSRRDEAFYWLTILVANTLGTALGDFAADGSGLGLGFAHGALLFAALVALVTAAYRFGRLPPALLFWAAYVLTRPLGATLGDTLTKPHAQGGLQAGRIVASLTLAVAMVLLITASPSLRGKAEPATA